MADSGGLRDPYAPLAFSPGVPETRLFPFAQWDRLHRLTLREEGAAALHHGDPQGHPRLRRAISHWLRNSELRLTKYRPTLTSFVQKRASNGQCSR